MKEYLKIVVVAVVAGLVAGLVVAVVGGNNANLGATGTRFPNGLSADTTSPNVGQVRGTTLTVTGAATLSTSVIVSSTGDTITRLNTGTCYLRPRATTIAATTTATVECQATAAVRTPYTVLTGTDSA